MTLETFISPILTLPSKNRKTLALFIEKNVLLNRGVLYCVNGEI
jgi:hypothetical protein